MTITATQLKFEMQVHYNDIIAVFQVLQELKKAGAGNVLNIEGQIHVTGHNIDLVKAAVHAMENQRILSNYKANELIEQIESFRKLYLK